MLKRLPIENEVFTKLLTSELWDDGGVVVWQRNILSRKSFSVLQHLHNGFAVLKGLTRSKDFLVKLASKCSDSTKDSMNATMVVQNALYLKIG